VDRLVILGQGYVALPVALRACEQGFDVVGFNVDESRIKRLATVEDVGDDRLLAALETGRAL
jgi:UDP-N-acetyl-D-glucosamine dehydrogenase